ncbi:MAG TPA: serine/threonine-protein kinase, partial [Pseudomonadota bacterium]|nr:serine/threonine-protein kinase [Pseudomonadota bacterium]
VAKPEPPAAPAPEPPVAAKPEPPVGTGVAPRALPGPKPPANIPLGPGVRIGRYVLQDALGEGATATVFRSFHELLSMPVAVKVFEPLDPSIDPEGAARFRREAQALVRLTHPNIVRIVDVDVWEGKPFIVMEYVGETTLAMQIQNLGRLPAARIAQIGLAVADALQAATEQGMLHRDVKPSNILERRDGQIKLVDFGIASTRSAEGVLSDPQAKQGLVSGTPTYIAPEQAQNPSQIDFRADMYSLGATLYHAAIGRPVFIRPTAYDLLLAHIHEPPVHINDLDSAFDPHLAFVIHRMLQKRPEDRFASWQELKDALSISLQSRDEPELLITQTSTGVDMPRRSGEQPALAMGESPTPANPPSTVGAAPSPVSSAIESASLVPTSVDPPPEIVPPPVAAPPAFASFSERVQAVFFSALAATQRAWLASPRLERGLAIGAVSLLLFTLAVLLGLSWRS